MAVIEFLGPLSDKKSMDVDIKSLKELKKILSDDEEVSKWLELCSIAINDKLIFDIETPISKNDKIVVLPPVCGG